MAARAICAIVVTIAVAGCDITVCELPEEDNVCQRDADCLLAFCGTSCCPCPIAVSRRQFDGTYCMVEVSEGFDAARTECREARETLCDDAECGGLSACPYPTGARCEGNHCRASYDSP